MRYMWNKEYYGVQSLHSLFMKGYGANIVFQRFDLANISIQPHGFLTH